MLSVKNPSIGPSKNSPVRSLTLEFVDPEIFSNFEAGLIASILKDALKNVKALKSKICEKEIKFGQNKKSIRLLYEKMMTDCEYIYNVFYATAHEVGNNRTYDTLRDEIVFITAREEKFQDLRKNGKIWEECLKNLKETDVLLQFDFEKEKREKIDKADEFLKRIDLTHFDRTIKLDFIEKEAEAKLLQMEMLFNSHKDALMKEIAELETEAFKYSKASREKIIFEKILLNELQEQIPEWEDRFDAEMTRRVAEITELEKNIEDITNANEKYRNIFEEKQVIVEEYLLELKRKEEEARHLAMLNRAAVMIQKIWRGYVARKLYASLKLLPKRKEKKKSKKGKKAKKKRK